MSLDVIKEMLFEGTLSLEDLRELNSLVVEEIRSKKTIVARRKKRELSIGDKVRYMGKRKQGEGHITEIHKVNAIVQFDGEDGLWRVNISALEKVS